MTIKLVLFVFIAGPLLAQASPNRISPPVERVETAQNYFLRPGVGEPATAEVGDSLYQEGIRTLSKRYEATLKGDASSTMDRGYVLSVKSGSGGKMLMRPESHSPLLCFMTKPTGILGAFGDANVLGCLVDTSGKQVFDHTMFTQYDKFFPLAAPVPYDVKVTETAVEGQDDFYVDVLYQGMSKGEVKISYREFSHGIARPAFTQDVSYELEADGTAIIGFKGMRIKVLKATGHDLRYILEQPMPSMTQYRVENGRQKAL
jgi:hypothetical protein